MLKSSTNKCRYLLYLLIAVRIIVDRIIVVDNRIANVLITNCFIQRAKRKKREIFIRIMTVIIRYLLPDRARLWRRDICAIGETCRYSRIFSPQRAQPFLIPSCRVLNSPLLLLLLAHTSRFSNYARVAYLTDGICLSLLLCSFLREPSPFLWFLVPL